MTKTIYIIPGYGETCSEARYKKLASVLRLKGYEVEQIKIDWKKPLSANMFEPLKDSTIVGFSFGAVLAYLIAKKYPLEKIILCSLSPLHKFSYKQEYEFNLKYMNPDQAAINAKDLKNIKISLNSLKIPYVALAGEKEKLCKGEFLVPKTGHFISSNYINCIAKLF